MRRDFIRKDKYIKNNYLDLPCDDEYFWWEKGKYGTMFCNGRIHGRSYEDEIYYLFRAKVNQKCDDQKYCKNCKGCCNNKISEYYKFYHYNLKYFARNNLFDHNKLNSFYFHSRCIGYFNQYLNLNKKKSLLIYIYFKEIENILTILGVPSLCIVVILKYLPSISIKDNTGLFKKINTNFLKY